MPHPRITPIRLIPFMLCSVPPVAVHAQVTEAEDERQLSPGGGGLEPVIVTAIRNRRSVDDPELAFDGYTLVDALLGYRLPVGWLRLGIMNLMDEDYLTSQAARVSDGYDFKGQGRAYPLGYQVDF
ncbi:TonB-dependent receptor [Modicisalibacter radicis]|uniref:TonB-dependent receptor n=1 Tax=Halomonas sp. EAR18 TaxID=2518972 RepID=UPI00109CD5BC